MAFSLTAGGTSGITVTGTPYLTQITFEDTSTAITFIYSDGTTTTVTGTDGADAIAAIKLLMNHVSLNDFRAL